MKLHIKKKLKKKKKKNNKNLNNMSLRTFLYYSENHLFLNFRIF